MKPAKAVVTVQRHWNNSDSPETKTEVSEKQPAFGKSSNNGEQEGRQSGDLDCDKDEPPGTLDFRINKTCFDNIAEA